MLTFCYKNHTLKWGIEVKNVLSLIIHFVLMGVLATALAQNSTRPDQIVLLYICQTEHDLEKIIEWESKDPLRYRAATHNGTLMPLDAARESAAAMIAADKVRCDESNRVVVELRRTEGNGSGTVVEVLDGDKLERYCPRTVKQYGHPCR